MKKSHDKILIFLRVSTLWSRLLRLKTVRVSEKLSNFKFGVRINLKIIIIWSWNYKNSLILDTAGQERFRSITQSYYRSAHALILVYDISCQPTFDALTDWIREIQEYANPKVLKILVGNKTDRDDREIPLRVGEEFAKQHEMYFLETSSKQGENGELTWICQL